MVTLFSLEVSLSSVYTRVQELYSVVSTVLDQQPSPPTPLSVRSSCHFSCTQLVGLPSLSETKLYLKYSSDLLLEHSSQIAWIEVVSFPGRFSSVILRDNLRGARIEAEHFLFICFHFLYPAIFNPPLDLVDLPLSAGCAEYLWPRLPDHPPSTVAGLITAVPWPNRALDKGGDTGRKVGGVLHTKVRMKTVVGYYSII